jgi:hypothetical protein
MLGDEVRAPEPPDAALDPARVRAMLNAYDTMAETLAADKLDGVGAAAKTLAGNAPNPVIARAAAPLEHAEHGGDIKETRTQFLALSNAVLDYVAANQQAVTSALGDAMPRKAYCPMYPGAWLQRGDDIVNPYYGSMMLHCGEFQELEPVVTE